MNQKPAPTRIVSEQLVEFLRTGMITPLAKGDGKKEVEAKLGSPTDWAGRVKCFSWNDPILPDFHDSTAWHYGSLAVLFPDEAHQIRPILSLIYAEDVFGPPHFPNELGDLPVASFTVRDLIHTVRSCGIEFDDLRGDPYGPLLTTEGGVSVSCGGGDCAPGAKIVFLSNGRQKPYSPPLVTPALERK